MIPAKIREFALNHPWLLIAVNLAGSAFGYWYYRFALIDNPLYTWPLIPVSPNATMFMAISLALFAVGRNSRWTRIIDALAFIGNLKYGLWTVIVMLSTPSAFLAESTDFMFFFLVVSHALMATQAFLIFDYTSIGIEPVFVGAGWYLLNDLTDYFGPMLHTPLPKEASFSVAGLSAILLTFASVWSYLYGEPKAFKQMFETE